MAIKCPKCHQDNPEQTRFCGNCGTRFPTADGVSETQTQTFQPERSELPIGSTFAGRYLILEELGRGGMGRVYRVLDTKLDLEIALKLIKPEIASDSQIIERFKNELKLTRGITHKNICRMFDLSEYQGQHYITMEYISGENLKRTIRRVGSLNPERALAIAKEICEGLAAAHHLDIVHRDLKPQNIMLDHAGNVRIMDFGISRSLRARGMTADGVMIGTPEYISPEQADGSKVDIRTDIYSLGAILFEMVTGKVPFEGDTTLSIILKQKLEPPPDPKKLNPHLPKDIGRIILKCLEKDKDRRYPNAEALSADLESAEKALFPRGQAAEGTRQEREEAKKGLRPSLVAGIAVGLIVVLAAGYFAFLRAPKNKAGETAKKTIEAAAPAAQNPQPPPAPAKEAPTTGTLEIDSVPPGASVVLNDKVSGTTPFRQEMPAGKYVLTLRKSPGYKDANESFSLQAGEKWAKSYLLTALPPPEPAPKTVSYVLEITSTPDSADITIDGVAQGKTPKTIDIGRNSCLLELRKGEGFIPVTEIIHLNPGKNTVQKILKPATFNVEIITNPPEARVRVGNLPETLSPVKKAMAAGVYPIKIEKDGYRTFQDSLSVEADITKTYELSKLQPAKVRINVNPYADVYIDEKLFGEVPPVKTVELAEGKHALKFVSAGLNKTVTVDLTIRSGESKEVRVNMLTGESKIIDL